MLPHHFFEQKIQSTNIIPTERRKRIVTKHSVLGAGRVDGLGDDPGARNVSKKHRSKRTYVVKEYSSEEPIEWLIQATQSILTEARDQLKEGKWHQVVSLIGAWSSRARHHETATIQIESLLKLLVDHKRLGNNNIEISIDLYNKLLDAWACNALFGLSDHPHLASKRTREILLHLQESYETGDDVYPDSKSFGIVLHCVCRVEGALVARRLLAWMEYLSKTGKNSAATPIRSDYIMILDCYSNMDTPNSAILAEGFIRHMNSLQLHIRALDTNLSKEHEAIHLPDTYCYNILLKTWNKKVIANPRQGRHIAEQADRILEEMKMQNSDRCKPDLVTYASKFC